MKRIAFVGLGVMGSGMARRLMVSGLAVTVHNRTRAKAEPLIAAGARWAATPRQAAEGAEAIFAMVADDDASRSLWLGHEGILAGAKAGALGIECSTISVAWGEELRGAARAAGLRFLDAPVTGSKPQAAAGELVFMIGGESADIADARPLFEPMGSRVVTVGGPGAGTKVKLINNFLSGVQTASLAEALALMDRLGVDPDKAMEIISAGAPGSPMIKTIYQRAKAREESPQFALKLMAKDLNYAQKAGVDQGLPLRTAAAALALFQSAAEAGEGEKDMSAVVRHARGRVR